MFETSLFKAETNYLSLPANQLLEKFGEGHIPGSGSAGAFSGLLAIELLKTVCKLTLGRREEKYVEAHQEFRIILDQLETVYKPKLLDLFHKDIAIFKEVNESRILRDVAKVKGDDKEFRRLSRIANDKLKEATEIPLEIARTCLGIIDYGFILFDKGFQSARGDSGVAISNILSAVSGSIFVTLVNIRSGRPGQWIEKLREETEFIGTTFNAKQKLALGKVIDLYREGITTSDYQMKLVFE